MILNSSGSFSGRSEERDRIVITTLALSYYLLLADLREQAAPVPRVITVGESEYERRVKAEAKRKKELAERKREEAKERGRTDNTRTKHNSNRPGSRYSDPSGIDYEKFIATAYSAGPESTGKSPGDAAYGITASGRYVRANHTLACPKSIALGTRIEIEGLGVRTCDDRGAAITEGRLDIYFENVTDARQFGRRTVRARILK